MTRYGQPKTRELWLRQAVTKLTPLFTQQGVKVPDVQVSVGFPKGHHGGKNVAIGQCWASAASKDKVHQLFVSPTQDDPVRILDILMHELVHAVDDCKSGHKGAFATLAKGLGLEGKMTATVASEQLKVKLTAISTKLGPFPHAALQPGEGLTGIPKQTTRMLKVECPECGYSVRTTRKWIDVGLPTCPEGHNMEEVA